MWAHGLHWNVAEGGTFRWALQALGTLIVIAAASNLSGLPAQNQGTAPRALNAAKTAVEAAEEFEEYTSYEDIPHTERREEKLADLRLGLQNADETLTELLKNNPKNVQALLLQVHLDEVKGQIFPLGMQGGGGTQGIRVTRVGMPSPERDPQKTLDLVLQIDPDNAEAYYLEARFWGMLRVRFAQGNSLLQSADFGKAAEFARKAVQKAPESVAYREALAAYLNAEAKPEEATEALRGIDGAHDSRYRLLVEESRISAPEGSVLDPDFVEQTLSSLQHGDWDFDFPALRLRVYIYPGPLSKVEAYYQQRWKGFRLQSTPDGKFALFDWRGDNLEFSPVPATEESMKEAQFWLFVQESPKLTDQIKERLHWKQLLDGNTSDVACFIWLVNQRKP